MSLTYGFYNSLNGDRKYNAKEMASIFDGIIQDGIYMSIGDQFMVKASSGLTISVGSGRAWFNHTWTLNDSTMLIDVEQPDLVLNRIDAVVIEVDHTDGVRANTIKIVKGTPASNPVNPELVRDVDVNQYPLAYIYVKADALEITQADITNTVGLEATPYVTGVLQKMNIDDLVAQWKSQWDIWMETKEQEHDDWTTAEKNAWKSWVQVQEMEFYDWLINYKTELENIKTEMDSIREAGQQTFSDWFAGLQTQLSGDVAGNLLVKIDSNSKLDFDRYYGLLTKSTIINKDVDGNILNIIEESDEAIANTTFEESENKKIITTELVPTEGSWKYIKTVEIITTETGKTVYESCRTIGK